MQPDVPDDQIAMDQYKKLAKGKQCEMQWLLVTTCAVGRAVLCVFSLFALKQFIIWDVDCRYAVCWQELIHMPLQSLAQHITGSDVKSQICHKQASFVSRLSALMLADTTKFQKVSWCRKQLMHLLSRDNF